MDLSRVALYTFEEPLYLDIQIFQYEELRQPQEKYIDHPKGGSTR